MQYSDFTAALAAALVIDTTTDTNFNLYLPRIIEQAELRCYRDLDLLAMRKSGTITLAVGAYTASTPSDWIIGRRVWMTPSGGTKRIALERREEEYLLEYWPDPTQTNTAYPPRYWTEQTAGNLLFSPTADQSYGLQLLYTYHPAPLSGSNATTVLSTVFPDLFFAAAMYFGAGYQKNFGAQADDPRAAVSWDATYQKLLAGAMREESRRKAEGYFDPTPTAPPSSDAPRG
jgi:hypothetical protein